MMNIEPMNGNLQKAVVDLCQEKRRFDDDGNIQDESLGFFFIDYDMTKFNVKRVNDKICLYFQCFNFQQIYNINGENILKKYYPEFSIEFDKENFNLCISADIKDQLTQINDDATKEQKKEIRQENKKKIEVFAENISKFRRNFYSGPFELAFKQLQEGNQLEFIDYQQRPDEQMWIQPSDDNDTCTIWFGINFPDQTDRSLAKIILDEMQEANKIVKGNCPTVKRFDKVPDSLKQYLKDKKIISDFGNGITSITIQKEHLKNGIEKVATYMQGLRQYIHYQVHSLKTYIHGRLRKKLQDMQKQTTEAKFLIEDHKTYRTNKEENQVVEITNDNQKSADINK